MASSVVSLSSILILIFLGSYLGTLMEEEIFFICSLSWTYLSLAINAKIFAAD